MTMFDSLGNEHIVTLYYQKTTTSNEWDVEAYIAGEDINPAASITPVQLGTTQTLTFDPAQGGELDTLGTTSLSFSLLGTDYVSGAAAQSVTLNFAGSTQNSAGFSVVSLSQDGFPTGRLSGLDISDEGLVRATFTNGQAEALGKIALANFANAQGLKQVGNTSWLETVDSGQVLGGEAGTGVLGLIQSGALEASNVDLTAELVGLITAQRNFQANSKAIETNNAITQTIINLR
jgi:flagellar hook protein FlgE